MSKNHSRELRILGVWLSISRNRCSISSWEVVLLKGGKKRGRQRLDAIFKSIGKVLLMAIQLIVASSSFVELALIIKNWLGW